MTFIDIVRNFNGNILYLFTRFFSRINVRHFKIKKETSMNQIRIFRDKILWGDW